MAAQDPNAKPSVIRHRIKEITLHPTKSKHPIELEISVNNETIHKLPTIDSGKLLGWDIETYPCDVNPGSRIELKFIEKHRGSPDREVLVDYIVPDHLNLALVTKRVAAFPSLFSSFGFSSKRPAAPSQNKWLEVTVKFPDLSEIANDYSSALQRAAKMAEDSNGPLARMGNARAVLKTILDFGAVVAELHPTAKLVVGLCTKAWERLEKIQQQHEDLKRLMDGVMHMQPFIQAVQSRAKEPVLLDTIDSLLRLLEDTSNFIINWTSQSSGGRMLRGFFETTASDSISELLQEFGELKDRFDRGVGVQIMKQVDSIEQSASLDRLRASLGRLNPAARAHYAGTPPCQDGTRRTVLEEIYAWALDHDTSSKLLWLYGQAGMGKSSIASSICRRFEEEHIPSAHFFCKRDDEKLRTPDQILNTLIYKLACQYEPYGKAVASLIESDIQLLDSVFQQRYKHLVVQPLQTLESAGTRPTGIITVIVDAIDECEQGDNRRLLLTCLREMSQLAPGIKVLVTSRPDLDIKKAFKDPVDGSVDSRSLLTYDATGDIFEFTRKRMSGIAEYYDMADWPEDCIRQLSTRANGLFIWAETACKFIERGSDMNKRLENILADKAPLVGSEPLDALYTTAITQSMGDQGEDNVRNVRECLGAIVATASRTPLSVSSLELLLSRNTIAGETESPLPRHIEPGVIRKVVNGLGSVLYEDQSRGGVVRVYHPSFADFILNHARSKAFYTDPKHQNEVLAECCLQTMMLDLRFNICGLETSHVLNREVKDLETRLQTTIKGHVSYSCMHWTSHLNETSEGTHRSQLDEFLHSPKLLYWIEAMSLLGQLSIVLASLLRLVAWTSSGMESQSKFLNDTYRFVLTFYDAISESTPHLYISALAFAPTRSKLAQEMRPLFPNTFMITAGANDNWPSWLQSMAHSGSVSSIACSGDGRRIVSGSRDGTVRIWDSDTGATVSEPLESPKLWRVSITSDGRRIASGSSDGTLRVWDAETSLALGEPFGVQSGGLISITFSSNGRFIISGHANGTVSVWDIEGGIKISELLLEHSHDVVSIALSPDERHIASCSDDETIRVWDAKSGTPVTEPLIGHTSWVECVAFSPNGHLLASGSDDATVRLWDLNNTESLRHQLNGHSNSVYSVAFSPNGRYLVSGSVDRTVRVWDVEAGAPVGEPLVGHTGLVELVAFCSNGRRVVSASDDKTVRIWDMEADLSTSTPPLGHSAEVHSVAFSADSRYLVSGSDDGTIRIWDSHTGADAFKPLPSGPGTVHSPLFTPDSQHIISPVGDTTMQVWDVETGVLASEFLLRHSDAVSSISLSLDGHRIASSSWDGTVGLWEADTGTAVFRPFAGHSDPVRSVALSPDGRFIASGSDDHTVRIWGTQTGVAVGKPLTGHSGSVRSVCFSPDSRRIASGSWDKTVRVWDIATGAALFEPMHGHSHCVNSVVFSPDGRHIISGSYDRTVRIWEADTGAAVTEPLLGHSGGINSIAVSPDSHCIASGSDDQSVRFWDLEKAFADPGPLIATLRSAPSNLSLSTGLLARYVNESGWVTSSDGGLLLWLPKDRRHIDDSSIQLSADPLLPRYLVLDFSRFVHGDSWASAIVGGRTTVV